MSEPSPSIPTGNWILVTGATGFLASHIVKQFAERGYRVRGTVRDLAKAQWLVNDPTFLKPYADNGGLELVQIPDLFSPDADLAGLVKEMSAIVHVATDTSFSPDPNKVIPQTVAGVTALMEAAAREPSVKEFVYTSSFLTAAVPMPALPGTPVTAVKRDTWNDASVQMAWAQAENPSPRAGAFVYTASKVEAEKAVWKFVAEKKPGFAVNTICPSQLLGEPLCKAHVNSGAAWIRQLYDGETARLMGFPAGEYYPNDKKRDKDTHVS
jgi:nucleoside-diphosphate-sugar epimerase